MDSDLLGYEPWPPDHDRAACRLCETGIHKPNNPPWHNAYSDDETTMIRHRLYGSTAAHVVMRVHPGRRLALVHTPRCVHVHHDGLWVGGTWERWETRVAVLSHTISTVACDDCHPQKYWSAVATG